MVTRSLSYINMVIILCNFFIVTGVLDYPHLGLCDRLYCDYIYRPITTHLHSTIQKVCEIGLVF